MKSLLLLTLALFIVACCHATAQSDDVTFWDWVSQYDQGYGVEYYTVRGELYTQNSVNPTFGLDYVGVGSVYGFYFPFMRLDKDLSWGIQPNITGATGYSFAQAQPIVVLSIPVNLMIKYGTDAEYYGKKTFGLGAGIGYRLAGTLMGFNQQDGYIGLYHHPIIITEASVRAGKLGLVKARFMTGIGSTTVEVLPGNKGLTEFTGKFDLNYYALYFTYTKNF